ncbi:MAG: YtxH domain-containing protein [Saprospiraceae bacterium]|uniref:YtxH domain-containing protein n=1 Tax=Candidatus Defluviibacterium haderslevense TaxID=2981993 RepID=A0A9D7SAH6_9BACT|nr:YtxH domain-containing protein [Candidatus Defluviibacterium haderslevense]MBK9718115.1 YtxH domain-containing protein [Candidatus Defluviibacterium haderslevense]MBL0237096.1 YtxH domain-containing protein [Candidatus Defluviibacterium haderslevense]
MKTNKLAVGLLVGLSIGGIVGVLFAPKKGSKLRKKMFNKGSELTESLKSKFGDVITNVADSFELGQ